jgi:GDP-L-fucose synthase
MKEEYIMTDSLEPTNEPYALAKISAIKLCRYYNEQYGTNFISVMPTNLYGPGDNLNLETAHVLPALIRKFHLAALLKKKRNDEIKKDLRKFPIGFSLNFEHNLNIDFILKNLGITSEYVELWGSGEPYREFLFVDDLAEACVFLMENYDYKDIGEFVNIGTGEDIKIKDLARLIKNIVGFDGEIKRNMSKPDGTPKKLLDISRIKLLGWKPKVSLEEGVRIVYEWYVKSNL